ncbi:YihY/virulence factor BrkB family protein [Bryobacter aggregatus]|uniref:YihY/virulence factor BrkB family protein n=1 Tax=Bryobacter aggregatus TaxID=360054 RepID=UPI0004E10406|nr:YihY/virulence factor BrkB family protein [Bryobacter aggregatus]
MRLSQIGLILKRAAIATYRNGLIDIAKGAAFSALLSFFPVLTTLATVLVQANAERVSQSIAKFLFEVVPPGTEDVVQYAFTLRGARPNYLIAGAALLSVWSASDVVVSLMSGFQAAYRTPNARGFWQQRRVAILLVFSTLLPTIGASLLLVFGENIVTTALSWMGILAPGEALHGLAWFLTRSISLLLAVFILVVTTSWLYRFAPSLPQRWSRVWPGAIVTTVLWSLATLGFGWYVRNIATYNIMYGSIGAAIALLVWMYLLSLIALFGCAYNAEAEKLKKEGLLT